VVFRISNAASPLSCQSVIGRKYTAYKSNDRKSVFTVVA
jgi:hypothetical protein